MAIAEIKKTTIIVPKAERDSTLRLLQAFQKVELITPEEEQDTELCHAGDDCERWNEAVSRIVKAQGILSQWEHVDTIGKLRKGLPYMTISELEGKMESNGWEDICTDTMNMYGRLDVIRTRRTEIHRLVETWSPWRSLFACPQVLTGEYRYTDALAGSITPKLYQTFMEQYETLAEGRGYSEELFSSSERVGIFLLFPRKKRNEIHDICKRFDFALYDFPYDDLPQTVLDKWAAEETSLVNEEKELLESLTLLAAKKPSLDLAEEFYRNLAARDEARNMTLDSKATFLIMGWVDSECTGELEALLKRELSCPYYISFAQVEPLDIPNVPIILKNKKMISAFETLTEMYSMPAYDEVDPTPVMAPFYMAFFGMMVADVGYGLVLMLGTLFAKKFFKFDKPTKKNIDFFFYLSFPVMAWGFLYGSIFGISLPVVLLSPTVDIIPILVISVVMGWIQIMTGLGLNAYIHLKKKEMLGALSGGVSWMLLLSGLALLVVSKLVLPSDALFNVGVALCIVAALGIVFLPVLENTGHRLSGFVQGLYALYGASGYIGDLVSYTRLMALGVAGSSIAIAFNTIIGALPLAARLTLGVFLALILHALNLFLSLLGAYVHGIRLQYVEFFGKFYSGGGRKFSPFKTVEKYINLIEEHVMQTNKTEESL
ncbi:MAG: V-type ATP synthase subunit I [Clostridiaceae bacterium]|nr:V-type ATP synthase subunit I [Clostridiaceae bacterium]